MSELATAGSPADISPTGSKESSVTRGGSPPAVKEVKENGLNGTSNGHSQPDDNVKSNSSPINGDADKDSDGSRENLSNGKAATASANSGTGSGSADSGPSPASTGHSEDDESSKQSQGESQPSPQQQFQSDPQKSAFVPASNKAGNGEPEVHQQQQHQQHPQQNFHQQPVYNDPNDMARGGGVDYGFRNGMNQMAPQSPPSHQNNWGGNLDDGMNTGMGYGPPHMMGGIGGMPPGIPGSMPPRRGMNNFGGGQQFNMGRQFQGQQQNLMMNRAAVAAAVAANHGGWGSPSHNPVAAPGFPPNINPAASGWGAHAGGGGGQRGGGRMGGMMGGGGGGQRNKIFGNYTAGSGNQYNMHNKMRGGNKPHMDMMGNNDIHQVRIDDFARSGFEFTY